MEGVGARLGRSSSRYGTTTVFTGPVRKWHKNWVPITPPPPPSSSSHHHLHHSNSNHNNSNGSNNSSASHLRLYKWTPLSKENNNNNNNNNTNNNDNNSPNGIKRVSSTDDSPTKDLDDVVSHQPPRRKFKFIPIAVLEERKKENENSDNDAKAIDTDGDNEEQLSKGDDVDEKPDINDVPMEENQDSEENETPPARQDLNELDLSLGLTSHEDDHDSDSK